MVCGTCQHDNQPNAKFCSECGAPLARPCPSCGSPQLSTAKFCDECGTALTPAPPPGPTATPAAARKRVTALFADLVGSTAFAERLDAEAVRAGLAPYFELLQSTIDDHTGTVVKFLGDGMFALFGVPEIAEDDALRAVTAAVDLQRRFRSFADQIRDRHGVELGLRVGVNTGELVIGADDVDLVGDVLNTASRLEAACEPGHVLVGEDTWRLTRSSVNYEVLGEVRVKGKTEPVATFQVVEESTAVTDELTPFVGRASELDALRAVFDDAVASSVARLATVIGDPGVGKTRLAQELRTGSDARSFDLRLERRGSTTFAPIADLLRDVTGSGSVDDVDRLVEGHPEASRLGAVLASFLGHGEPRTTEESFWAVRRLLELLAASGPVIVVVDDIQWAEPLFWDLLEHLVEWTAAPVLLIALARPELREQRPELTQPGRRVSASIALEGLDPDTTLELAARLLGIDELPADLAERLPESTEGNPLFVRELVQMLVDDGVLARDGDRWRLTIDADAIEVPPTILSLLASRVERLPDDERQVVELASVIGAEFDRGTLNAIATGGVAMRLGAVIDRLRRKDLVEPTGQWAGDHPVYRFHHVLIRDAAYRRLLKGHRAELHERVGRHVETTGIADDERDVIVAHHFEQVYRYRAELGAIDDRTRALAVEAAARLRSAAEEALGREDLASAGSSAIRALGLLDADAGAERDELLLIGCEALLSSADVARGAPLVDELHTRSADARLAAWADCFRAQLWSLTAADRLTEAGELAADAADRLVELGDHSGVAKARLVRAGCLARLGRVGDCEAELDLALGAARAAGDRRRTVSVLGAAPLAALWGPSPVARAGGRCLDVLRLLRITTASPTVEATSIRCQGMLEALRGRDEAARAKFETSRAIARELGLRHALFETELFAGLAELLGGDAVAAEPHLRAAHEGLGRLGIGADAGQAGALLARSLLLQGRVAEADALATAALDTAGQNLQTAIAARAVLAEVRAAQGNHEAARALVDEALAIVAPTDVTLDHALTLLAAGRVAVAAGDVATSSRRMSVAAELLAAKGVTNALNELLAAVPSRGEMSSGSAEPEPHDRRIRNRVLEIAQRSAEFAVAGDRASFTACYSPDLTYTTHRELPAMFGVESAQGSTTWADFVEWLLNLSDARLATVEPLAIRGHHHALYRSRIGSESGALDRLVVVRGDGQVIVDAHFYDPDQLVEATAELERQWVEHDPSAIPYSTLVAGNRVNTTLATGDPEAVRALVTADFVAVDHRQAGLGERRFDDWIASNDISATGHTFLAIATEILNGDDRRCLVRLAAKSGDDTCHTVSLMELRDGLVSRVEQFDEDDVDAAAARYEELAGSDHRSRRFTNTAWELSHASHQVFARRDADEVRSLLAADFRGVWHERLAEDPLEGDLDTFIDVLLGVDGDNRAIAQDHDRLLAMRGDHLALTWNRIDMAGAEQYLRYRVNESLGRQLIGVEWFDEDQLDEAVAALDRRWLVTCGVPSDSAIVRAWPMTRSTRAGDIADLVHPEFEYTDHCRLRADQLGGDLKEFVRRGWVEPETWTLVTNVHRFDESGAVYERVEYSDGNEIPLVWVAQLADGAMRRVDRFDHDDLDAAIALFDSRRPVAGTGTRGPLTNTAWEISLVMDAAFSRGDREEVVARLAPEFVTARHVRLPLEVSGSVEITRERLVDTVLSFGGDDDILNRTTELLAIRGDRLALTRETTRYDTFDQTHYTVIESDDHHLIRIDWFNDDQLPEAQEELDRRWMPSLGFDDEDFVVRHWDLVYNTGVRAVEGLLHPDFEYLEHRPLHYPSGDAAVMRASMGTIAHEIEVVAPCVYRVSRSGAVFERIERASGDAFGEDHMVLVVEIADDAVRRIDAYTVDDLPAALARYDEIVRALAQSGALTSGPPTSRQLTNMASRLAFAFSNAEGERGTDRMSALLASGFTVRAHGRWAEWFPQVSARELLTVLESREDSRVIDVVAVRGEYLSLIQGTHRLPSGFETDTRLFVVASDDQHIISMDWYQDGQDADAFAELDRRYRQSLGIEDDDWRAETSLLYTTDFAAFEHTLHPEFEYVERRRRGFPNGDAGDLRDYMATYRTLPEVRVTIPVIHRFSEHGLVYERLETADHAVTDVIMVCHFQDEHLRRLISYEPEDLDRALAEFDAFVARRSSRTLTNRAWEIAEDAKRVRTSGDRDRFATFFAEDFVVTSHDSIMAQANGGTYDKALWLDAAFDPSVFGPTSSQDLELVAVRGDDRCLFRSRATTRSGDLHERLNVLEVRNGLAVYMEVFPHDQLREAQTEIDRRYRRSSGIGDDHWIAVNWHVLCATDFADIAPVLHRHFEFVERRPLAWPNGDAADWRKWLTPDHAALESTVPAMHRLSEHGVVTLRSERFEVGDLGVIDVVLVNEVEDGRVRRVISYEPEDLDRALAEFDEFVARREAGEPRTNAAWELAQNAMLAHRDRDRDRFASFLTDDFTGTAHDPIMSSADVDGTVFDRALFVEASFDPLLYGPGSMTDDELIAVRGDDHCLFRIRTASADGDVNERIHLLEVRDGLGARWNSYSHDQMREAQIELDRTWLASLGYAEDHPWFGLVGLFYDGTSTVIARAISEHFEYVDHRRLSFPDGGRSQILANADTLFEAVEVVIPRYVRLTDRLALGERIEQTVGGADQSPGLYVTMLGADGLIEHMEIFEIDDEAAAIACFDRLVAEQRTEGAGPRPLTNAAWEVVRSALLARRDGDREGLAALLDEDFVHTPHHTIMASVDGGVVGKSVFVHTAFDAPLWGPSSRTEHELIAVRGDDLCLYRLRTTTNDDDLYERIILMKVRGGLAVRSDSYEYDQLAQAQIELDRRSLASVGFAEDHPWYAVIEWFYDPDPTVVARELPDNFRYVDHRQLAFPDGDVAQMVTNIGTRLGVVTVVPRYLRITDRMTLFEYIERTVDGAAQTPGLMVSRLGPDGRPAHLEIFEVDDEPSAIACFERLLSEDDENVTGLGPLTNAAWETVRTERSLDDPTGQHELIAVRSDRFCLARFTGTGPDGQTVERLVVSEVVDGQVERSTSFEADDLAAALTELDAWYCAEIDEPEIYDWMIRMTAAFGHGTYEDFRSLVTDDFESVDERRLGLGRRTADQWAASYVPLVGLQHPVVARVVKHDGPIWLSEYWAHFGGDGSEWHSLLLLERDGHRLRRQHEFDLEQAELAFARYEELVAARAPGPPIPGLTNRAWEIAAAFAVAYAVGDRDVLDRLVDPDGEVESRGQLSAFGTVSGRAFLDFRLAVRPGSDEGRRRLEIVAVRGEHHCLLLVDRRLHGDLVRLPIVVETDDERINQMVWFDDDQLIDAQLELDRRWLESIGYADHWFEPIRLVMYDPHPDAIFEHLAPAFEYVDHRPLMFPSGDAEQLRSNIHSMQHDVVFTIPRIHRISDAGSVIERIETAVGEIGQTHVVFVSQFVDQRVQRMEAFDITQLGQALARYDEFIAGRAPHPDEKSE